MNCKPGDLAVIVRSNCGNEGRIVRCVAFVGVINRHGFKWASDWWRIDQEVPFLFTKTGLPACAESLVPDHYLRPIRDTDGEDEMLRIAGRPQPVEA